MHGRSPLIADNRWIEKVFHPVFPPDRNADDVLAWPRNNIDSGAPGGCRATEPRRRVDLEH